MTSSKTAFSRRQFLATTGAGIAATSLPWGNLTFAQAATDRRLIVILLRGGLDGLSLFPPFGDKNYIPSRQGLAIANPLELNDFYGLHPAADALLPFWVRDELLVFPTSSTGYSGSNHADGQSMLETGAATVGALQTGWLSRALDQMGGAGAISAQYRVPALLRGPADAALWNEARTVPVTGLAQRLAFVNDEDPLLTHALARVEQQHRDDIAILPADDRDAAQDSPLPFDLAALAPYVGNQMAAPDGAKIAVFEASGWDTHFRQGAESGRLARRFAALSTGLEALAASLGHVWGKTVILVASEFGRQIRPNDWQGTDNGGATAIMLLGGAVKGGRFLGKWPGLAPQNLRNGGLATTVDMRAIFKALLAEHLKISAAKIDQVIFPDSVNAKPQSGIFR